ncbi:hypothetical protein BJ741DRAFT_611554 [Chytriomyces cf. hyalinus JEL632]|nr:hypothetical protein BJ741DRAFT_611554 [Chytriomyces cf. hyalinus JEL632]
MPNITRKPRIPTRSASLGKLHNVDKPLPDIPSPATLVDQDLPEQQHDPHDKYDRNSHYARTYSLLIEYYYSSQTSRSMQTNEDDDDDTGSDMTTSDDSESEYSDEAASRQSVVTDLYTVASSYHPKSYMSRSVWTADEATVETLELQDLDENEYFNEEQVEQIVSQLRSRGLPVYEDSEDSESEYDDEYDEDDEDTDGMSFVASLTESTTASIRQAEKVFGLMEKHGGVKLKSLLKDLIRWKHAKDV